MTRRPRPTGVPHGGGSGFSEIAIYMPPPTSAASLTLYPNNARRALRIINYVADGIHRIINLDARHSRSATLRRLEALSEKVLPTILTIPCASGLMSQIA